MSMHDLAQLGVSVRPIVAWPGKSTGPESRTSPFRSTLSDTAALLAKELRHLGAKPPIVLEMALREGDIRNDGLPRADARVSHPGIILSFECRHGWLRPYTDACRLWEHNLRAIAMHLEHLRLASLYGVGKAGQQYAGWKALPMSPPAEAPMTLENAAMLLAAQSGFNPSDILKSPETAMSAFRRAAMRHHPDKGGDAAMFKAIVRAKEIVEKHHV